MTALLKHYIALEQQTFIDINKSLIDKQIKIRKIRLREQMHTTLGTPTDTLSTMYV